MSYTSDVAKALKTNGFKLVEANRHLVYENADGRVVRLHLGGHVRAAKERSALKDIRSGDVKSGKVRAVTLFAEPVWVKDTPKAYRLVGQDTGLNLASAYDRGHDGSPNWRVRSADGRHEANDLPSLAAARAEVRSWK